MYKSILTSACCLIALAAMAVALTPSVDDPSAVASQNTGDKGCCAVVGMGNVDESPDGLVTMGDLTVLIDHLFITLTPLVCPEAANVDMSTDGLITMGDLTVLIDHLFITLGPLPPCPSGTVTDVDGNVYWTVTIGDQVWMAGNLKVTHYRSGEAIPGVADAGTWGGLYTGAYCEYNNDVGNVATYGRLYNWYAVGDSRNLAPAGWHVPTDAEWQTLVDHLGGSAVAGGKMKEAGYVHWLGPNTGATNESGFSALPGGYRVGTGAYYGDMVWAAYFWSSTEQGSYGGWDRYLPCNTSGVTRNSYYKRSGFSVRCVKDY